MHFICSSWWNYTGIGTTTLNNNQILIGNGTNAFLQYPNIIWDNSANALGVRVTQLYDTIRYINIFSNQ
jgi:hypothetical protein